MTQLDAHLASELSALASRGVLREPIPVPSDALVLCSNDYLGYGQEPMELTALAHIAGGAGASRLISGDHPAHRATEDAVASWLGYEAALLVSSGYAANVGVLSALAGPDDVIISDALNHASIIDGCRLSRAQVIVTEHLDLTTVHNALERSKSARCRWLVTESYFSMDGDVSDLASLRKLADAHDAFLVVDEAHALGIFGDGGAGRCQAAGVQADVLIGTLGKALGLAGAFICGSHKLRALLWNRARSFVFSTGVSPLLAAAARQRIERVQADAASRSRLWAVCDQFRTELASRGAPVTDSVGPIVPWVVGPVESAVAMRDHLLDRGLFVQAIRPPTVPRDSSRLRITLHAKLTDGEIQRALDALVD